jgi:hypothetical protein
MLVLVRCWLFWPVRTQGSPDGQGLLDGELGDGKAGPPYGKSGSGPVWEVAEFTVSISKPHKGKTKAKVLRITYGPSFWSCLQGSVLPRLRTVKEKTSYLVLWAEEALLSAT